jgi:hypothetical protein
MKAVPRSLKFAVSLRTPLDFTSAKRFTPNIAYIRMMSKSKLPIFVMAGRLVKKVIKVLLSALFFLKMSRILTILKERMIVV